MLFSILIAALTCYLLGNLNGAVCMSALMHDDVRSHGSGNAGLTNFIRNYGAGRSLMVIAIDVGKAVLACLAAGLMLAPHLQRQEAMMIGGLCVLLGHDFPALLGFRGGKGILSGFAIAMTIDWRVGLLILAIFALAYGLTQYVSLGSVLAAAGFAIGFVVFHPGKPILVVCGLIMSILVIFMHRGNIQRLLKGEERKTNLFGKGNKQ